MPLNHRGHRNAGIHLEPMDNHTPEQTDAQRRLVNPLENPQYTSLLAVLVTLQGREGSPKRKLKRSRKKGWVGHMFICFNI